MPGDWAVRRPDLAPGGWAFEFENDNYPDTDDTADRRAGPAPRPARRGHGRARGRRGRARSGPRLADGHAEPRRRLGRVRRRQHPRALPPPAVLRLRRGHRPAVADVTAHVVEFLAAEPGADRGRRAGRPALARSSSRSPTARGSAGGAPTTSTAPAPPLPALVAAGAHQYDRPVRRAVEWLARPPERRRRLGRGPALLPATTAGAAGASRRRRRRRGRCSACSPPASAATPSGRGVALAGRDPAGRRHAGTSPGSPASASPATSTSTTTSTGRCSRCRRSAATWRPPRAGGDALTRCLGRLTVLTPLRLERRAVRARRDVGARRRHRRAEPRRSRESGGSTWHGHGNGHGCPSGPGRRRRLRRRPRPRPAAGRPRRRHRGAPGRRRHVRVPGRRRCWPASCAGPGSRAIAGPIRSVERARPWRRPRAAGRRRRGRRRHGVGAGSCEGHPLDAAAAVVRAVVDTARRELVSPWTPHGTLAGRPSAARRGAGARALGRRPRPPAACVLASPRGFCAGVERAIDIVERALDRYGPPVYVRRQIIHNTHVVADLADRGAVFVDELDEVPDGSRVVFAAHGVAPAVRDEAGDRDLAADRRHVPARGQGPLRGAAVRRSRLPGRC